MRRVLAVIGLEAYAVFLSFLQSLHGVTTDEAKYLLNIPYPHPPLVRWLIGLTSSLPGQEMFWRVLLATLLIQAVWLIVTLVPPQEGRRRIVLAGLWLSSAAVVLYAGTILMAPLTALQILLFLWLYIRGRDLERYLGWISLLWLASLFSAYQIILFLPLVAVIFLKMRQPLWLRLFCLGMPVLLLMLYTCTNPLVVASMVTASEQNAQGSTFFQSFEGALSLWVIGGSVVVSILGTWGMVRVRRWPLVLSLILVCAFIFLTFRAYYALLFTPLFIAGIAVSPSRVNRSPWTVALAFVTLLTLVYFFPPDVYASLARTTMRALDAKGIGHGTVLLTGSFGHEWQYESAGPVRRFTSDHVAEARAVICLTPCEGFNPATEGFVKIEGVSVDAWARLSLDGARK